MRKLCLLIIGLAISSLATSQTANTELIGSSGNSFNNSTYRLDWSLGEIATNTFSEGSFMLTQGFHQGNYTVTAIEDSTLAIEDLAVELKMNVYPNPTTDIIHLQIDASNTINSSSSKAGNMNYTLTNIIGEILQRRELLKSTEQLDFSGYTNGVYFLKVKQENQLIKTFKIVKN